MSTVRLVVSAVVVTLVHTGVLYKAKTELKDLGCLYLYLSPLILLGGHLWLTGAALPTIKRKAAVRGKDGDEAKPPGAPLSKEVDAPPRETRAGGKAEGSESRADEVQPRREWGMLPPVPARQASRSTQDAEARPVPTPMALGAGRRVSDLGLRSINTNTAARPSSALRRQGSDLRLRGSSRAVPPTAGPKPLTRHLSCGSSYELFASDIDTPLQQALSLLNKMRAFLAHLDPESMAAALAELDCDDTFKDHRSETSSIYSSTTARRNSGFGQSAVALHAPNHAGTGSPFRPRKRINSPLSLPLPPPPVTRVDSVASLHSLTRSSSGTPSSNVSPLLGHFDGAGSAAGVGNTSTGAGRAPPLRRGARVPHRSSGSQRSLVSRASQPDGAAREDEDEEDGDDNDDEFPENESVSPRAGDDTDYETEEGDGIAPARAAARRLDRSGRSVSQHTNPDEEDSDEYTGIGRDAEHDRLLPASPSGGFHPIFAVDRVIEILLEPESLMKPVIHSKANFQDNHAWLSMVGAMVDPHLDLGSPMGSGERPSPVPTPRGHLRRQRSRLSSDELSSIKVTSSGQLLVESASSLQLSEMIHGNSTDALSSEETASLIVAARKEFSRTIEQWRGGEGRAQSDSTSSEGSSSESDSETGLRPALAASAQQITRDDTDLELKDREEPEADRAPSGRDLASGLSAPNSRPGGTEMEIKVAAYDLAAAAEAGVGVEPKRHQLTRKISVSSAGGQGPLVQITLGHLGDWNFDSIEFAKETDERPLYTLLWALFTKHGFLGKFNIDRAKFKQFSKEIESGYNKTLPYHNSMHAADVLMSLHYLLFSLEMGSMLSSLEKLASLVAAAIHDFMHPGRNNAFLIKSRNRLSIVYNDQSVLEQMHLAEAFRVLAEPESNVFENLSSDEWDRFRRLTIRMVLATDLKDHFETVTKLRNLANSGSTFASPNNRELILEVAIKVADIGHAGKAFNVHSKWALRIQEEFLQQGDHERRIGLPVSEFMDRSKLENDRNQQTFFEYIALPLFQCVRDVFPPFSDVHRQARRNHAEWKRRMLAGASALSTAASPEMPAQS